MPGIIKRTSLLLAWTLLASLTNALDNDSTPVSFFYSVSKRLDHGTVAGRLIRVTETGSPGTGNGCDNIERQLPG